MESQHFIGKSFFKKEAKEAICFFSGQAKLTQDEQMKDFPFFLL